MSILSKLQQAVLLPVTMVQAGHPSNESSRQVAPIVRELSVAAPAQNH